VKDHRKVYFQASEYSNLHLSPKSGNLRIHKLSPCQYSNLSLKKRHPKLPHKEVEAPKRVIPVSPQSVPQATPQGGGFKLIGQRETRLPTSLRPAAGTTNRPRKNREKRGKSAASESAPPVEVKDHRKVYFQASEYSNLNLHLSLKSGN